MNNLNNMIKWGYVIVLPFSIHLIIKAILEHQTRGVYILLLIYVLCGVLGLLEILREKLLKLKRVREQRIKKLEEQLRRD